MKIFGNNIDIQIYKTLLTDNVFSSCITIYEDNKDSILLTPWTNISEILNFNKKSALIPFFNSLEKDFENSLINQELIIKLINELNSQINEELLDINLEYEKIIKTLIELKKIKFTEGNLMKILNLFDKYCDQSVDIIISGFNVNIDQKTFNNLNILKVVSTVKGNINFDNLMTLIIHNKNNDIIEIEDAQSLVSWLESKTKTVLTMKDINSYFNGEINFNNYLIEKAFSHLL